MLTHGKEVRRVSFLLTALKAFPAVGLRVVGKVSFSVRTGYFLTEPTPKFACLLVRMSLIEKHVPSQGSAGFRESGTAPTAPSHTSFGRGAEVQKKRPI